ncbi:MAG: dimethyl sulfoxide reductase anchor subunit [Rhodocyclaceae bacterium]|jgi:DMSO reductase anchor subunit|nr:dimethyl sulfoxide reductase anchor subunit [Rhodocyclaceae bacterium]
MHPAFSVVFLTTLIGAGQGLFLALFTVESYAAFGLLSPQPDDFYALGSAIAFVLLVLGLIASFFHLGHPERAWRAAAKWRTSWLSREVIVLPAFMGLVCLYGCAHWLGLNPVFAQLPSGAPVNLTAVLGSLAWVLAFALYICTGMIYACLKFLREWHTPLTVINYILLGGASGFTLAAALAAAVAPEVMPLLAGWALIITFLGLIGRAATLIRNARLKPKSTLQTAIGVKHPKIMQKSMGLMGGSFNTREFFHGQSRSVLRSVKWLFLVAAFFVPMVLLAIGLSQAAGGVLLAAFVVQYLGLIAERWFFFAQANHPQNLYYQSVA